MGKVNIKQLNVAPASGYVIGSGAGGVPVWKLEVTSVAWNQITGNQALVNLSGFTNDSGFITLGSLSAGTGISYNNLTGVITNSAPDQTVVLTQGTGITITGTYPNFTIASNGNQTITLSGDVTGSGTTGIVTTIANNAVTTAKILDASVTNAKLNDMLGNSVIGRSGNTVGVPASIQAGMDGQVLRLSGATLGFGTIGSASITANSITDGLIRQSAGLSVIGRSANSTGNVADITAGTDLYVLRRSGTSIGFGLLTGGSISATNNQLFYGVGGIAGQSANMTYDGSNFAIAANSTFTGQFNSVSNITNGVNYSGTSTATATGAYGVRYSHILTANNSANHTIEGVRFAPTLVAASNFNFLYGVVIDPTFTNGAFTSVNNVPLQIMERTVDGQTIRIQHASGTSVGGITINDVSNVQRYALSYNGSNGQAISNMSGSSQNRFNYSNSSLLIQNAFQTKATYFNTTGYYSHTPTGSTATSGTSIAHNLSHSFAPTSGTGIHNWIQIDGAINQTGGASGITRGLFISHTLTAAADYRAIEVVTGKSKLRDTEVQSTDAFYLGDANTDGTWRIIRSGNDLLSQRRESGSYVTKQTITP